MRDGLGETEGTGLDRNCRRSGRSSWGVEGGAKGRKGEKQSVKWREESKRQRPLSIQAREMEDGDVDR